MRHFQIFIPWAVFQYVHSIGMMYYIGFASLFYYFFSVLLISRHYEYV